MKVLDRNTDIGLLILRLSIGALMLMHGIFKLIHGIDGIEGQITGLGLPAVFAYGVYIGEVIAPFFIIIGVATRLASVVFVINCIVAIAMVHSADIFTVSPVGAWGIELLGLYLFGALTLVFTGGGKYALSTKQLWD